ncbi:hypothetical protein CspeluHIS016_0302610 [Cutaneotrichosporon spelunceum]|uniref:Amino acid permease/ SLC12A domain-containing protein n=1 Tax=Cutaneotrichosporon spelunceum TaxID=1672016 RepID=A0AAD3YAW9_9TREE|nr:hypothetical protein CspeluHIS016_0302610 [Cutaneotrichosporon spelunceum]
MSSEKCEKSSSNGHSPFDGMIIASGEETYYDPSKESWATRAGVNFESFKRAPGSTRGLIAHGDIPPELLAYDNPMLQQKMQPRHLQMIAVGGAIGTGLFVGSGEALAVGGPAAILLAWTIMGIMVFFIAQALGELAILYPVSGGFFTLASRMLDPSLGVALGWNYVFQWAVTLPLEITVATSTVMYWENAAKVPLAVWYTIFFIIIIIAALFGTLGFAETEFWVSALKLIVVVMFLFIAVICVCGGGPAGTVYESYVGARYWHDPGAFANGFKGVCSVFITAAFSYAGSEIVSFAATETPNPRKTMPSAIKNIFWRIIIVYLSLILLIGLAIPYTEELLTKGEGANGSPFVIVMRRANISGLDSFVNITIVLAVLAMGLTCVYGGSRPMVALSEMGYGPKFLTYVDKSGRPLWALALILAFGPIAYLNLIDAARDKVFDWLLALSGLSTLFTWLTICLTHIRFRRAWVLQGHSVEELPYRASGGIWGSYLSVVLIILVLIAQFYAAVWPIGEQPTGGAAAEEFFATWLSLPVILLMYLISWLVIRTWPKRLCDIDLDTGRKSWLTVDEMRQFRADRAAQPWYKRLYRLLFG